MGSVTPEPLYVCVHVPEFPAQARLRVRAEQARMPVVVLEGEPPLESVCSANNAALGMGIGHGTTRAELDSFDGVTILRRSLPEERAARAALLGMAGAFTPRTQVCAAAQAGDRHAGSIPFAMVLDMSGSARLFGTTHEIVRSVADAVRALGLRSRLAAAPNYRAAVCAAAFAHKTPLLMTGDRQAHVLGRLPLSALELTDQQRTTFDLWGLRTLGELAALPEVELVARLGQEGKRLRRLARGEHEHLMVPEEPALTLDEHIVFEAPEERLEALLFVLGPMLDQLILRAGAYALALASVTVRLTLEEGPEHVRTLKPALPINERDMLLKLLHLDLQANPPNASVAELHLHAEPGKRNKAQSGLFNPPLPEPMRLDITLARIAALVGEGRVGAARLQDTHNPEAFAVERFTVPQGSANQQSLKPFTAVRRMRPPVPLTMRVHGKSPASFYFSGKRFQVTEAYGPWRRSGEWWTERRWAREEWDVRAAAHDGEMILCVVMQDLLAKDWLLEALYD